jgi:VanZ family protein
MGNKHLRIFFWLYLSSLILIAILPLNSNSSRLLGNVFMVHIRLDYLIHSIIFTPWTLLYLITFRPVKILDKSIMIGKGLLMASATEGVQYFLTYRSYNINDLLANLLGVVLGSVLLFTNIQFLTDRLFRD